MKSVAGPSEGTCLCHSCSCGLQSCGLHFIPPGIVTLLLMAVSFFTSMMIALLHAFPPPKAPRMSGPVSHRCLRNLKSQICSSDYYASGHQRALIVHWGYPHSDWPYYRAAGRVGEDSGHRSQEPGATGFTTWSCKAASFYSLTSRVLWAESY